MTWVAPDATTSWTIDLVPDGFRWSRQAAADPDCVVTAGATDLLLSLYGRRDAVAVSGDVDLWQRWIEHSKL